LLSTCPENFLGKTSFEAITVLEKVSDFQQKINGIRRKIFSRIFKVEITRSEEHLRNNLFLEKVPGFSSFFRIWSLVFWAGVLKLLPTCLKIIFGEKISLKEL